MDEVALGASKRHQAAMQWARQLVFQDLAKLERSFNEMLLVHGCKTEAVDILVSTGSFARRRRITAAAYLG